MAGVTISLINVITTQGCVTVNLEILVRILISPIVLKHICHVKNWGLLHDLPASVKDKVFSPFCEGIIYAKFCICDVSRK